MITDLILSFFLGIATDIAGLLPNIGFPSAATDAMGSFTSSTGSVFQYLGWANYYLPMGECFIMFGLATAAWGVLTAFDALVWILTKAHVLGGSSS